MAWFSGPGSSYSSSSRRHHSHSGHHHSSSSAYKRSPREGYVSYMVRRVRRMLRDLWHYAQRHPMKVLTLVVLPLVTGGALTKILAQFGIRLPPGMFGGHGGSSYGGGGGGFGGSRGEGPGLADLAGLAAGGGGAGALIQLAKLFM